jgi:small-conductance mechanosensitive channel
MNSIANLPLDFSALDWHDFLSLGAIFTSILLIVVIGVIRGFAIRYIRKDSEVLDKDQRRWTIRVKNISAILLLIGLVLIWAPQLHTVALSITAFVVALVIATKEMILCLTGAIMRATTQPFKAGEWITIDGVTGEVIDLDAFAFRLQEVDMEGKTYQFTGRTITVPNSKLFTSNIENANFFKAYIFEDVRIAVQYADIDPCAAMEALKDISERAFAPYRDDSLAFNRKIRRRAGIDIGSAEPVFDLTTSELGHFQFHARFFLPTGIAPSVGSDVTRDFLAYVYAARRDMPATKAKDDEFEEATGIE